MSDVFHYTGVDAYKSIIESGSLRMTRSEFLNDPEDSNLLIKIFEKSLNEDEKLKSIIDNFKNELGKPLIDCKVSAQNSLSAWSLYNEHGCDLPSFLNYVHDKYPIYVISLTNAEDDMNMWNCYGSGGMSLNLSTEEMKKLAGAFTGKIPLDEADSDRIEMREQRRKVRFLTFHKMIYIDVSNPLERKGDFKLSDIEIMTDECDNIFVESAELQSEDEDKDRIYQTDNLIVFFEVFLKSYFHSLDYQLRHCNLEIEKKGNNEIELDSHHVFDLIISNMLGLYETYEWKRNLFIYLTALMALVKNKSYEYEKEYRIVYFEYIADEALMKKEKFDVKRIGAGNFLIPYIEWEVMKDDSWKNILKGVTVSPMTKNLPIDSNAYRNVMIRFLKKNGYDEASDNVKYSKHQKRW